MKLYKLKDIIAVFWFFIIILLQYNKYYTIVIILLTIGMICDLIISLTDIGNKNIKL